MNGINIHHLIYRKNMIGHALIGALIGYFIIHPITMIMYWFEYNNVFFSLITVKEVFGSRFLHSFSIQMLPMSMIFIFLGGIIGIGSGLYSRVIKKNQVSIKSNEKFLNRSITKLLEEGESQYVEYKSSLKYDYRQAKSDKSLESIILKTIAGFLNSNGGILIIGVDDYGDILGLANDYWTFKRKNKDGFQQHLILIVSNAFGSDICQLLHITFHPINDKEICAITIDPARKPVYIKEGNRTIFYLRTGNITKSLTTKETVEYLNT